MNKVGGIPSPQQSRKANAGGTSPRLDFAHFAYFAVKDDLAHAHCHERSWPQQPDVTDLQTAPVRSSFRLLHLLSSLWKPLSNHTKTIHNEVGIRIHKEDRRYRRLELSKKRVYRATHKAPKTWTMRIRNRRESIYYWRLTDAQILLKRPDF